MRNSRLAFSIWLAVVLFMLCGIQSAPAQTPEHDATADDPRAEHADLPEGDDLPPPEHQPPAEGARGGPRGAPPWQKDILRPMPQDRGPVTAEEEGPLLEFAREHMPRAYQMLQQAQQRRPLQFRRRMQELAPRLRHLRRVWSVSPELGALIRDRAETEFEVRRGLRELQRAEPGPARAQLERRLREKVGQTVLFEIQALEVSADFLQRTREERIGERVDGLLAPDLDITLLPPQMRAMVERYRGAQDASESQRLRDEVRRRMTLNLDEETTNMRDKAARLRKFAPREADRRFERMRNQRLGPTPGAAGQDGEKGAPPARKGDAAPRPPRPRP